MLSPATVTRQGYLRPEAVGRLVAEHRAGRVDRSRELFGLVMLQPVARPRADGAAPRSSDDMTTPARP
jgi:hypothetical protein